MSASGAEPSGIGVRARPAAVGAFWLRGGILLFRRRPLQLLTLSASVLLAFVYLFVYAPAFLRSASLLFLPALLQLMLSMSRAADEGAPGAANGLAAVYGNPVTRLRILQLGVIFALVYGVLNLSLQWLPEAGAPAPTAGGAGHPGTPPPAGAAGNGDAGGAGSALPLLAFVAAIIPVLFIVQFATALVAWHRMPALKALFFACFASWRNFSPILIYLLALFGLVALLLIFLMSLALILQLTQPTLFLLYPVPPLLVLPVLAASGYVMVRDVIVEDGPKA